MIADHYIPAEIKVTVATPEPDDIPKPGETWYVVEQNSYGAVRVLAANDSAVGFKIIATGVVCVVATSKWRTWPRVRGEPLRWMEVLRVTVALFVSAVVVVFAAYILLREAMKL